MLSTENAKQILVKTNGASLRKARELGAEKTIEFITKKGLKGRGGAGNLAGKKWGEVAAQPEKEKYFVVNCDEGEPGTFKDRFILENNCETFIEGIEIACFAIGARKAFVYVRGEYTALAVELEKKIAAAKPASSVPIEIVVGAGAYVCGEQTALLNSIEGRRGTPRLKPPFPATYGLYGKPTVVNNVETVTNAALAFRDDWNPSLYLFSVSGNVRKPGVYERPLGVKLGDLLADAEPTEAPKAVFFGAAGGCLKYDAALALDHATIDAVAKKQTLGVMLGSCTVVVVGVKQSVANVVLSIARFFEHESCGNCAPCREITGIVRKRVECALAARSFGSEFAPFLESSSVLMRTASLCGLGQCAIGALVSAVKQFPSEFR